MAAEDTRHAAHQFNFNQRMVLMILLYISYNSIQLPTPHVQFSRNVVGGKKNKFGLLLLRFEKLLLRDMP